MKTLAARQSRTTTIFTHIERSCLFAAVLGGALWLAADGDLHWDEPAYFYQAAYLDKADFLAGTFQPSGIDDFYFAKILHLLIVRLVSTVLGTGESTLVVLLLLYASMLVGFLGLTRAILQRLLPATVSTDAGVLCTAGGPLFLYLLFKTVPDIPALFLATGGLYALIRSLDARAALWMVASALCLVGVALTKNSTSIMVASFVISALLLPPPGIQRSPLFIRSVLVAVLAAVGVFVALALLSIDFDRYLHGTDVLTKSVPAILRFANTILEFSSFWLVVPLAFLSHHRRLRTFFLVWFLLATLPFLVVLKHVESRYLVTNLVAFSGLASLALTAVCARWHNVWTTRPHIATLIVALVLAVLIGTNWVALRLMPAEVNVWDFRALLARIEAQYPRGSYVILTPWPNTDFNFLRFTYPQLDVVTSSATGLFIRSDAGDRRALEDKYYEQRVVRSIEDLKKLQKALVYVGFGETFMVANLKAALAVLPGVDPTRVFPGTEFIDHFSMSWMWNNPALQFDPLVSKGYYRAFVVSVRE